MSTPITVDCCGSTGLLSPDMNKCLLSVNANYTTHTPASQISGLPTLCVSTYMHVILCCIRQFNSALALTRQADTRICLTAVYPLLNTLCFTLFPCNTVYPKTEEPLPLPWVVGWVLFLCLHSSLRISIKRNVSIIIIPI